MLELPLKLYALRWCLIASKCDQRYLDPSQYRFWVTGLRVAASDRPWLPPWVLHFRHVAVVMVDSSPHNSLGWPSRVTWIHMVAVTSVTILNAGAHFTRKLCSKVASWTSAPLGPSPLPSWFLLERLSGPCYTQSLHGRYFGPATFTLMEFLWGGIPWYLVFAQC